MKKSKHRPLIILLEDNIRLASLIEENLKMEKYEVFSFYSSAKAGEFIFSGEKKLENLFLILDYSLSDEDAPDFIKLLKKKNRLPSFIVISGYSNPEIKKEMKKLGALKYIIKTPDFAAELSKALKEILE